MQQGDRKGFEQIPEIGKSEATLRTAILSRFLIRQNGKALKTTFSAPTDQTAMRIGF
jgi:hypothetical protein